MEAGNAVRILQSHNREHDQRTGPAIEVVLILHKSPQGYVGILAAAEIPKDVLWSARWPSRNRRGDALSGAACTEVAIANLDVATSLREQPFPQMFKYFVDATPQFCLGNVLHIAGSGRGAQFFDQFFRETIGMAFNEAN